jgi:hypothetical protein
VVTIQTNNIDGIMTKETRENGKLTRQVILDGKVIEETILDEETIAQETETKSEEKGESGTKSEKVEGETHEIVSDQGTAKSPSDDTLIQSKHADEEEAEESEDDRESTGTTAKNEMTKDEL